VGVDDPGDEVVVQPEEDEVWYRVPRRFDPTGEVHRLLRVAEAVALGAGGIEGQGDELLVDLSKNPGPKSLLVTFLEDEVRLFQGNKLTNLDDIVCGVVTVIVRPFF
jgi:hypothetical protein